MKKILPVLLIIFWGWHYQDSGSSLQRPEISTIEKTLLEWVNKERTDRKLGPLNLSADLRKVAEGHSRDMASRRKLTHLSSGRKSFEDRLLDAGMFFIEIGENVATSETFDGAFIHQGFMDSPEHRDNILNPNFDTIGISVVYANDNKYYVTQDFIQSLDVLEEEDATKFFQDEIDRIRKKNALPALSFQKTANIFAQRHAKKKAAGQRLLNVANFFGETHVHFITTPRLTIPENVSREIASGIYESGGIGAWFGRLPEYPGGTYLITLFLFPISQYKDLTEEDLVKILLRSINAKRNESGLASMRLDEQNSLNAANISRQLKDQQTKTLILPKGPARRQVISYVTEDIRIWPANLDTEITNPGLRRIGIGISSQKSKDSRIQTFWVTLIF